MILDLLVYNYTIYYSFFFLNYLNLKNIYLIICVGLLIDNILSTYVLVTIILVILYYTLKKIKNYYILTTRLEELKQYMENKKELKQVYT